MTTEEREWLRSQVAGYRRLHPRYERYATLLEQVLEDAARTLAPLAIVTKRAKSIPSFAEKALRKRAKYQDPVTQLTDLCGARVILRTRSEADAFSEWIEKHFEIDVDNSVDASERLQPTEFGYRSVHYIVSIKPGVDLGVRVPRSLYGLKAEVQVRTTLEHAWADFGHDLSYKGAFKLPAKWERELAVMAAGLEDADEDFARIEAGLKVYATSYGSYLDEPKLADEIATLETVLEHDAGNSELAWRIGKLAMTLGDWKKAVETMSAHVDFRRPGSAYQPLLRDLGVSLCKLHGADRRSRGYRRGQRYLELAAAPGHRDPDALSSLAGTWRGIDDEKARELYRLAFELDPTDYYALTNFLEYEIRRARTMSILDPLRPTMIAAIARCHSHADVGINLPWALYGLAKLHLLVGEPYESLRAYAKAVRASTAQHMIEGSLESLERLSVVQDEIEGYEWARRMLLLGLATKFKSSKARRRLRRLASEKHDVEGPVVMVVGGTHPNVEPKMRRYRRLVLGAFRDYHGTIVCGGTTQGISGHVGELAKRHPERIRALAYLPKRLPPDATLDTRYKLRRRTEGNGFTPLEPLQAWTDIVVSRIDPKDVRLLGINGGDIAAVEFRVALALGALVGVVQDSGREAARLLADETWAVAERLVPLPEDSETARAFIGSGRSELPPEIRDTIAELIHEEHRVEAALELPRWSELPADLQDSSRAQADHIRQKLRQIGCDVRKVRERTIALMTFTDEEVEALAEMEHGRWNAERLCAGWRLDAEKDVQGKVSPYLVPWTELAEEIREWDRATVRKIPRFLEAVGLEIYRQR